MKVWMGAWAVAGVLLLPMPQGIAATASPGSLAAVRQQVESSMLISGDVHIEADGSVSALMLHNEAKLPEGVVKLVRGNALQWRFEPIVMDGKAVRVVAPMSLRVVARQLEGGSYEIALRGVNFQKYDATDAQSVAIIQMNPPRYPERAYKSGASGSVYLLVKVGRNGRVEDAFAEQVNLTFLSRESDQRRFRELLARNAVVAAKGWTFRVPSEGDAAAQPYWNLRVPVSYTLSDTLADRGAESYGRWTSYVAGPRERAPWRTEEQGTEASPDSFADGGIYMADRNAGPRLLTPLQGG